MVTKVVEYSECAVIIFDDGSKAVMTADSIVSL